MIEGSLAMAIVEVALDFHVMAPILLMIVGVIIEAMRAEIIVWIHPNQGVNRMIL